MKKRQELSGLRSRWTMHRTSGAYIIQAADAPPQVRALLEGMHREPGTIIRKGRPVKNSRHTLCLPVYHGSGIFFIKAYRSSGHLKSLSYILRPPKAMNIWNKSWLMWHRHMPVMLPLGVIQARNPWNTFYGALIYPWKEEAAAGNGDMVKEVLASSYARGPFLRQLASDIFNMHEHGIYHGDCKIANFILTRSGHIKSFFDLDSARLGNSTGDRHRITDLACMGASLEKCGVKTGCCEEFAHYYARQHLPWQQNARRYTGMIVDRAFTKMHKSRNRKPFFSIEH